MILQLCQSNSSTEPLFPVSGADHFPTSVRIQRRGSLRFLVIRLPLVATPWFSKELFQKSLGRHPESCLIFFKYFNLADQSLSYISSGFLSTVELYEDFQSNLHAMVRDDYPALAPTFASYVQTVEGRLRLLSRKEVIDGGVVNGCTVVFQYNSSTNTYIYIYIYIYIFPAFFN
jgi:hypothetical protein